MDPEDYPYCLDCFIRPDPGDDDKPAQQVGSHKISNLEEQAERLIRVTGLNTWSFIVGLAMNGT
jgi:hypothetical protein